jgi:flagellar basal-body rod modification protein FlgD
MTGVNPIVTTPAPPTTGTPSTPGSSSAKNPSELGPDAFITLLTAQLQAQDPLNPMDPNQMVTELTSMNTLQETIQIRQDLDTLAAASKASSGGSPSPPPTTPAPPTGTPAPVAASALSSGLAALTKSLAPSSVPSLNSQVNAKSQLF